MFVNFPCSILGASTGTSSTHGTTHRTLQRNVISQNPSFSWLLAVCDDKGTSTAHKINPTLVLAENGSVVMYTKNMSTDKLFESSFFDGTIYSWLTPIIEYDWRNPERTRRFVSIFYKQKLVHNLKF